MFPSSLHQYPSIFCMFYLSLLLPCVMTLPLRNKTYYQNSVDDLVANKCKMPEKISLPFNDTSDPTDFNYLSIPLKECQTSESLKENNEVYMLCKEIFQVLKNITCSNYNTTLPEIKSTRRSKEVCQDFKDMEGFLPKQAEYLAGTLVNDPVCKVFCKEKWESLCRILVWSYDVQAQIENALESSKNEDENGRFEVPNSDTPNRVLTEENDGNNAVLNGESANTEINVDDAKQEPVLGDVDEEQTGNMLNDKTSKSLTIVKNSLTTPVTSKSPLNPISSTKLGTTVSDNQSPIAQKHSVKTTKPAQNSDLEFGNITDKRDDLPEEPNIGMQNNGQLDLNKKHADNSANPEENKVEDKKQPKDHKPVDASKVNDGNSNLIPGAGDEINNNKKGSTSSILEMTKNKSTTATSVQISTKLENPISSNVPEENELGSNNLQGEENESGVNGNPSNTQNSRLSDNTIAAKPSKTNMASNKVISDIESTTLQMSAGNSADEEQDAKDPDQYYNDTENEGDYQKSEYESTLNNVGKSKKAETKSSVVDEVANVKEFSSSYEEFTNAKTIIGRRPDEIQMISSFPEQEDSHFFFYFLSIVLILMAGYLIFHNKQKIIALIVEGRHERRRRSHGAGYKKLETK